MDAKKRAGAYLLLVLFFSSLNLRSAITSISPLVETIQQELGMNRSLVSLLVSIPVVCMGLFAPLASHLAVRRGIERSLVLFLFLIGLGTVVRTLLPSTLLLLSATILVGVGIAVVGPLLSGFVKKHFPDRFEIALGIYIIGMSIGAALAAGTTVPLRSLFGGSWEMALSLWGMPAFLALLFWWPVMIRLRGGHPPAPADAALGKLPWRNRRAWLLVILFGTQSGLYYSVVAWLAPFAMSRGMSEAEAGSLMMVFSMFSIPCGLILPHLMRLFGNRRKPWLIGSALTLLAGLLCMIVPWSVNPWIYTSFLGIGLGALFNVMLILPLDETDNPYEANAWSSMMQGGGYVLSGLIPVLAGFIRDRSGDFGATLAFMITVCLVLLFFSFFLRDARSLVILTGKRGKEKMDPA
jgi:CP family cyanate transporter-like MFS transporter